MQIETAKTIAKFAVSTSVGFTVSNVLRTNTTTTSTLQRAEVVVGAAVTGMMVAEKAEAWTDTQIDKIVAWYRKTKEETEK